MVNAISKGLATFVTLLVANVLMKIFGLPLIGLIPSGTWGLEWIEATVLWLGTMNAVFWYFALGVATFALVVFRSRWLTRLSDVTVVLCFALGIVVGGAYRLTHPDAVITNLAADPSSWILVAGFVAPGLLWAIKRGGEEALWAIGRRRERRLHVRVAKPAAPIAP